MRILKPILITTGIALTLGLFIYSLKLNSYIKVQSKTIKMHEGLSKIDTSILNQYKANIKILKKQSDCSLTVDSMINKSKFLK
jgi:hypothetical protein